MILRHVAVMASFLALAVATPATAANEVARAAPDSLGECLVLKSTGADRINLARWFVVGLAAAPQLKGVADVKPETKAEVDRNFANIFTRLVTVDCLDQARATVKSDPSKGFEAAFGVLGAMASKEVLTNPDAEAAMGAFSAYIDEAALTKALTSAKP